MSLEARGLFPTTDGKGIDLSAILLEGFEIVDPVAPAILTSPSELEGVPFHKDGEDVNGEKMIRRGLEDLEADLGFADLKLCLERANEIPEELRGKEQVFAKAIAQNSDRRFVFYLYWDDDAQRWCLDYGNLQYGWDRNNVLGRRRKLAKS